MREAAARPGAALVHLAAISGVSAGYLRALEQLAKRAAAPI